MCTVSVFNSAYVGLSNWGNISLLVMCRKHALRIKYFRWAFSFNFVLFLDILLCTYQNVFLSLVSVHIFRIHSLLFPQ